MIQNGDDQIRTLVYEDSLSWQYLLDVNILTSIAVLKSRVRFFDTIVDIDY